MADSKANYFLSVFLNNPATSIPKGAEWAVFFEDIRGSILPAIELAYNGEPSRWNTSRGASAILKEELNKAEGIGCLFCQAIRLPGEGFQPIAEGIKYNGYIRSYVGAGRNDFPIMNMAFLETNVSFADTILRGWALATAKFGMISRAGSEKNYRTNMTCYKYTVTPDGPVTLMKIQFNDICCVSVDDQEYNYDHSSTAVKRQAQFVYQHYFVDTVSENPIVNA
jgi:hypothetical protein